MEPEGGRPSLGLLGIAWDAWLLLVRWWRELLLLFLLHALAGSVRPSLELRYWSGPDGSLDGLLHGPGPVLDALVTALVWLVFLFAAAALPAGGAPTRLEHAATSVGRALGRWQALLPLAVLLAAFDAWLVDALAEYLWQPPAGVTWTPAAADAWGTRRNVLRSCLAAPCLVLLLPLASVLVREELALGSALRRCWELTRGRRLRLLLALLALYGLEIPLSVSAQRIWQFADGGWGLVTFAAYVGYWLVGCALSLAWALWPVAVYERLVGARSARDAAAEPAVAPTAHIETDASPMRLLGRAARRLVRDPLGCLALGLGAGVLGLTIPLLYGKESPSKGLVCLACLSFSAAVAITPGASADSRRWLEYGWRTLRRCARSILLVGLLLFLLGSCGASYLVGYLGVLFWDFMSREPVASWAMALCLLPALWCCARLALAPAWIAWGLAPPAALAASVAATRGVQWLLTLLLFAVWATPPMFVWLLGPEPSRLAAAWGGLLLAAVSALAVLVAGETWRAAASRIDPRAFD